MQKCNKAFTLIELLVVISIIALLISILLPALGKAREAARGTQCMAKMRGFGVAQAAYLIDSKGWWVAGTQWSTQPDYCPNTPTPEGSWDNGFNWAEALFRYLSTASIDKHKDGKARGSYMFSCPNDPWQIENRDLAALSYQMNSQRNSFNATYDGMSFKVTGSDTKLPSPDVPRYGVQVHENWVPAPSDVFVLVDNCNPGYRGSFRYGSGEIRSPEYPYGSGTYTFMSREGKLQNHNGGFNWLFADGHAQNMTIETSMGEGSHMVNPRRYWTKTRGD